MLFKGVVSDSDYAVINRWKTVNNKISIPQVKIKGKTYLYKNIEVCYWCSNEDGTINRKQHDKHPAVSKKHTVKYI
jgi:hypothetical protein